MRRAELTVPDFIGVDTPLTLSADLTPSSAAGADLTYAAYAGTDALLALAKSRLGTRYARGGRGPGSYDCSGFVYACFRDLNMDVPYLTSEGWAKTSAYPSVTDLAALQPGDVLVFDGGDDADAVGHVGFYLGGGAMIDASYSAGRVRIIENIFATEGYWTREFIKACRIPVPGAAVLTGDTLTATQAGALYITVTADTNSAATDGKAVTVYPFCGMGTEAAPFLIQTAADFLNLSLKPDGCYRLACDIDFTDTAFTPAGTKAAPFSGSFDGAGYAISGVRYTPETGGAGLFGVLSGTVRALLVPDGTFTSNDGSAGAIAAVLSGGTVESCYAAATVSAPVAGGIAGTLSGGGSVTDCYTLGLTEGAVAGGIAGEMTHKADRIQYCYHIGTVRAPYADRADALLGGIAGSAVYGAVKNACYLDRVGQGTGRGKDGCTALGDAAWSDAENFSKLLSRDAWTLSSDGAYPYPQLTRCPHRASPLAALFAGGAGLPSDPYRIETAAQLMQIGLAPNASYALVSAIDLSGTAFVPLCADTAFSGVLDGCGYAITGLSYTDAAAGVYGGLFHSAAGASFVRLWLEDCLIDCAGGSAGGVAGFAWGCTFDRCFLSGLIAGRIAGGVAGQAEGCTLTDCANAAAIGRETAAFGMLGGMGGYLIDCTLSCCSNTGAVSGVSSVSGAAAGGMAGRFFGTVSECRNSGAITVSGPACLAGGMAGRLGGTVENCLSAGDVEAVGSDTRAGGVAGETVTRSTVENCCFTARATGVYTGGAVGVAHKDTAVSGVYYASGRLYAEMRNTLGVPVETFSEQTLKKLDFTRVWTLSAGTPELLRCGAPQTRALRIRILPLAAAPVVGRVTALSAEIILADGGRSTEALWSIADGTGAAALGVYGHLAGVAPGTVLVTAAAPGAPELACTVELTVLEIPVESLSVTGEATADAGQTRQLTVEILPVNAQAAVVWSSSEDSIASVDQNGLVTAVAPGQAIITAEAAGVRAQLAFTVSAPSLITMTPQPQAGVSPSPAPSLPPITRGTSADGTGVVTVNAAQYAYSLAVGESFRLRTEVAPSSAADKRLSYQSSDESVATVSRFGRIRARGVGACVITVTAKDGCGASLRLSVLVTAALKKITLSPSRLTLSVHARARLLLTFTPAEAAAEAVWSSSDPNIAFVDAYGNVYGIAPGRAVITCKAGGRTARTRVIVR